jgi:hypothetical protein
MGYFEERAKKQADIRRRQELDRQRQIQQQQQSERIEPQRQTSRTTSAFSQQQRANQEAKKKPPQPMNQTSMANPFYYNQSGQATSRMNYILDQLKKQNRQQQAQQNANFARRGIGLSSAANMAKRNLTKSGQEALTQAQMNAADTDYQKKLTADQIAYQRWLNQQNLDYQKLKDYYNMKLGVGGSEAAAYQQLNA